MTSHGRRPEFSGSAAEWAVFAEQLKFYFTANGISDAAKQSSCGTVTYKLLKTLVAPHQAKSCRFKDTVCNFCNKRGHLQRVCRSRKGQTPARKEQTPLARTKSKNQETRAHKMEEEQPLGNSASSSGTDTPAKP